MCTATTMGRSKRWNRRVAMPLARGRFKNRTLTERVWGGMSRWSGVNAMAEQSAISWTDATFNPWVGARARKISPACDPLLCGPRQ
jgi:hypothetical protein